MSQHILYVEDEESDAFLLKHCFLKLGIHDPFQLVTDGEEAIAYLSGNGAYVDRDHYPLPCLILLDLNLPKKNGFEILEWRRRHSLISLIPVVIFTSSSNPEDIRHAYELGASAYLIKLPNPTDWGTRASAIRAFWVEQNTLPPLCSDAD